MKRCSKIAVLLIALMVGTLANCGRDERAISQSEWEKLIGIRGEAREICRLETQREFLKRSKSGTESQIVELTGQLEPRVADILSTANLRLLQKIEDSYPPDTEDERKVRRLRHYLISLRIEKATEAPREYLSEMRGAAKFSVGGRHVNIEGLMEILSTARDRDLRQEAYVAWHSELQKENAVIESKIVIEDSVAVDLGYGDFTSLKQEAQQIDYARLTEQANDVLARTDSLARDLAATVVPQLAGLKADRLRGYDIAFLMSTTSFDSYFSSETWMEGEGEILAGLGDGFEANWQSMIVHSPSRTERPGTFAISIPDDVRIVAPDNAGLWAASAQLHELGHALFYRNTTEREFEFTQLGEGALKEAFAFSLEGLYDEAGFVTTKVGIPEQQLSNYLRQRAYLQLELLRSYCADFLFEQEAYAGAPNLRQVYEDIAERVSGYDWNDVDREMMFRRLEGFASAEYLAGWFLAAQIREYLFEQFGDGWYESHEAGAFLKGLWQNGTRKPALEIAGMIGDSTIAPDALLRQLTAAAG
ncbi:MAG: hypothetical protein WBP29_06435, partial [Candidatus Zixiibacteriota bacterium]